MPSRQRPIARPAPCVPFAPSVTLALWGALGFSLPAWALAPLPPEPDAERTVKGAPFCATVVHESVQTLADGNRIVRKQSSPWCRDGEGRTRREVQAEGGPRLVLLHDPATREHWVLNPEAKTARRSLRVEVRPREVVGTAGAVDAATAVWHERVAERMGESSERWREWAREVAQRAREAAHGAKEAALGAKEAAKEAVKQARDAKEAHDKEPREVKEVVRELRVHKEGVRGPEPGMVVETEVLVRMPGASEPQRQREVRVIRLADFPDAALPPPPALPPQPGVAPTPGLPALPGVPGLPPRPGTPGHAPLPPLSWSGMPLHLAPVRQGGVTVALPAKEIEGLKVHGERTTWTIEAGKLGNEKPLVSTREVWRSPELMLTVMSRDSDPRSGEVIYRLEKIKRGEPDAGLMKLPPDYTVGKGQEVQVVRELRQGGAPKAPAKPAD